jgi:YggT family protein
MTLAVLILATARSSIADFLDALLTVYVLLIIAYIITSLIFSFGGRIPYSKWSSAILGFLRDVCEPYLSLFRRFIPPIGPIDISPIVAILFLQLVVGFLLIPLIRG